LAEVPEELCPIHLNEHEEAEAEMTAAPARRAPMGFSPVIPKVEVVTGGNLWRHTSNP